MDRLLENVWSDKSLADKYRFERHIATSSMGIVVAARHLELEERVAIKFLSPDAVRSNTAVSRFRHEARAAAKIKSQHVVRVIDVATTANSIPYIVMEHLDGRDLEQLLADFPDHRVPVSDAVDFILQASEAVCEGHSLGIVHRDLKPANLFCVDRGDGYPLIKVLDFGISKFTTPVSCIERTDRHEILGSPRYMSPEQIESASNVDHRTDIWSLGVILYEALAGKPPFDDELILGLWRKIKEDDPEPIALMRTDFPPGLWQVVSKCLQKSPTARFTDLGHLARALAPFAPERSRACIGRILWLTESHDTSTVHDSLFTDAQGRVPTRPRPQRRPRRWLVAGGATSTITLGLGLLAARALQERAVAQASDANLSQDSVTANRGSLRARTIHYQRLEAEPTLIETSAPPIVPVPNAKETPLGTTKHHGASGAGRPSIQRSKAALATPEGRVQPERTISNPRELDNAGENVGTGTNGSSNGISSDGDRIGDHTANGTSTGHADSNGERTRESNSSSTGGNEPSPWLMPPVEERK